MLLHLIIVQLSVEQENRNQRKVAGIVFRFCRGEGEMVLPVVNQVRELHESFLKGFACRHQDCHSKYMHHSGRVR